MDKMTLMYFFYSVLILCFIPDCSSQEPSCTKVKQIKGTISESSYFYNVSKCWIIKVPADSFVQIELKKLIFADSQCDYNYLNISVAGIEDSYTYCDGDATPKPITLFNDVTVYYSYVSRQYNRGGWFTLQYTTGDFKESRIQAIDWLKKHQTHFGWGRNTHRAVTALHLTNAAQFQGNKTEEEVMVKQLRMRMAVALSRNETDPMSVNELSMYVNALTVTCHNNRNFFSKDLLKILEDRAFSAASPSPGAYLTLCNTAKSHWWNGVTLFKRSHVVKLLKLLEKDTGHQFQPDIQAMTVLALSCIKKRAGLLNNNDTYVFNATVGDLMAMQREDGSFGNPHTTAIVAQALLASGVKNNERRTVTRALHFLMNYLNSSSVDFLSVYLTLPLFAGKTLADIGDGHCNGKYRKLDEDDGTVDVTIDELGGYSHVQFSLYVGDRKELFRTLYLSIPGNTTAFGVMKLAAVTDPNYKFSYHTENDHIYIYKIAGLANDIESGEYWHLYSQSPDAKVLKHLSSSPDQIIVGKNEHLIMWYKTARI